MDRRDFMKITAMTGMALAAPWGARRVRAQEAQPSVT